MELFGWISVIFFAVAIIFIVLRNFYGIISDIINYFFREYINRYLLIRKLKPKYKVILNKHFRFYSSLMTVEDKILFEKRVQKFISMKKFIPRGELKEVTDEMKALIAGTAIQITFGYPGVYFEHFGRIVIYQDNYYSKITQKYHQGEVNMRGYIVLSWINFVKGFANDSDGRNLGYHEMAHALQLENAIKNREYDFIDFDTMKEFEVAASHEIIKIRNKEESFFREYASTNRQEFFAVIIENFFERPRDFKESNEELYNLTSKILKQNPLQ